MRTKLKKYDKTYKELTAENVELEKERNSASRESIQKKLEIQRKLSELDELRRTVDSIPDAVIREYTVQKKQAVIEQLWPTYYNDTLFAKGMITEDQRNKMRLMIKSRTAAKAR